VTSPKGPTGCLPEGNARKQAVILAGMNPQYSTYMMLSGGGGGARKYTVTFSCQGT